MAIIAIIIIIGTTTKAKHPQPAKIQRNHGKELFLLAFGTLGGTGGCVSLGVVGTQAACSVVWGFTGATF